jgi:D-glycero-D-manno-heptose 1,7-bisphosphate phosphatase
VTASSIRLRPVHQVAEEWKPIEGSLEAIALLNQWGWRVVVATNQSGVGRGLFDMDTLNAINERCIERSPRRRAARRHLLLPACGRFDLRLPQAQAGHVAADRRALQRRSRRCAGVGDSLRDLQAAHVAGAQPVLVRTGKGLKTEADPDLPAATRIYDNLAAMVRALTMASD